VNLTIKSGYAGVFASSGSDSDDVTLDGNIIYGNNQYGVWVQGGNERLRVLNGRIYDVPGGVNKDNQTYGVEFESADGLLSGNEVYNNGSYDFWTTNGAWRTQLTNNRVYANGSNGLYVNGANSALATD